MLHLNSILLSSDNPKRLIQFYAKVLDKKSASWGSDDWGGFDINGFWLTIGPHDKVKGQSKEPERMIINFETSQVSEEFQRIKGMGVEVIAEPYQPEEASDMWIATFADPDGNYFQLMSPMEQDMSVN
jgi:predicted enzyme related to lactoylglutathione lyase